MKGNLTKDLKRRFVAMYKMATSDGILDDKELILMLDIASKNGISTEDFKGIITDLENDADYIPDTIEEKITALYEMTQIMLADGKIEEKEKQILMEYARKFDFLEENLEDIANYLIEQVKAGVSIDRIISEFK